MFKITVALSILFLFDVALNIILAKSLSNTKKTLKSQKRELDNYKNERSEVEKNIKTTNKEKAKLHTANASDNIDNATAVMSNISKRIKER